MGRLVICLALSLGTATAQDGLIGHYFPALNFGGEMIEQVDPQIDFDWGEDGPGIVGPNNFSVRWVGTVTPLYSEAFTFYTYSDDGVRLWVDGQLLIDNWTNHGRVRDEGLIALQEGQAYPLVLEFYEAGGAAVIELGWLSDTQVEELIPSSALRAVNRLPDGEPEVNLLPTDVRATEGSDNARLAFTRWGRLDDPLTVGLRVEGDAVPGVDYVALPETLEFGPNQLAVSLDIVPIDDEEHRGRREVSVRLLGGNGYTLGDRAATVVIIDDERPAAPVRSSIAGFLDADWVDSPVVVRAEGPESRQAVLLASENYAITNLPDGDYTVRAWADLNENGTHEDDEPWALGPDGETEVAVSLPPDAVEVDWLFPAPPDAAVPDPVPDAGVENDAALGVDAEAVEVDAEVVVDADISVPPPAPTDEGGCQQFPSGPAIWALILLGALRRRGGLA